MTKIANHAALISLAVLALGCGDAHSSTGSGVASTKTLSNATAADVQKLCDWALGPMKLDPSPQQSCTYAAVRNSESSSECAGLVQSCLDGTEGLADADPPCPFSNSKLADCDLPVSDLEDCYAKAVSAARDDYENASCDTPPTSAGDENAPASCTRLRDRCPRVFDDASDPDAPTGDYQCVSGETIPQRFFCDGVDDCASGEDEMCSGDGGDDSDDGGEGDGGDSGTGDFVCNDGSVISDAYRCDSFVDCIEGEDEASCPGEEPPVTDGFKCKDGEYVKQSFVCDGTRDCTTGEDEATCDGGFVCKDGFDISDQWRCDTRRDCDQGEDELGC